MDSTAKTEFMASSEPLETKVKASNEKSPENPEELDSNEEIQAQYEALTKKQKENLKKKQKKKPN